MTRRFTKGIDLYWMQMDRFALLKLTMRRGHADIAHMALEDAKEVTSGGLSRRQTKGAFARGATAGQSTSFGRRRTLSGAEISRRGLPGSVPLLPINIQSGRLHRSMKLRRRDLPGKQSFDVTQLSPGGGIYRLLPGGTFKMVDSGYQQEMRRRWRPRNKAFMDTFSEEQKS